MSSMKGDASLLRILALILLGYAALANDEEGRELYLVLLEGESLSIPREHQVEEALQMQLRAELHNQILHYTLVANSYNKIYSFHHAINGFAIHTTPTQAKRLQLVEGVTLVEKDRGVEMMSTHAPDFLGLPGKLWAQLHGPRNAGEGIVIGFVDTGIDPAHPSFAYQPILGHNRSVGRVSNFSGPCYVGPTFPVGSCNGKIVSARHFFAGAAASLRFPPAADLSPFDDIGHGSHVASIAAGNHGVPVTVNGFNYGYASGMAPGARIAVYKAIYRQGGTLTDVVAAVDQAIRDRVNILTLAIGPNDPPLEVPVFLNVFEMALLRARRAGVFVAQPAGNKGPGSSTMVAFSPWSMAAAASSTDRKYISTLVLGNNTRLKGVGLSAPTPGNGLIQHRLVAARDAAIANLSVPSTTVEECQDPKMLRPELVRGNLVICNYSYGFVRGSSSLTAVLDTARALGFMGFIFVANPALGSLVVKPLPLPIPAMMIPSIDDVKILMEYYETSKQRDPNGIVMEYGATAAIKEGRVASYGSRPVVARLSSRGPDVVDSFHNLADVLKPDILAPGHEIWGAWSPISATQPILSGYNFVLISGTSMATPHVAGIAAIIKQERPSWNPSMIASAISTTALKHDHLGRAIMSSGYNIQTVNPSTPFDYGAGLISPSKALDPGLVFSSDHEDYVAFLCSIPGIDKSRVQNLTGGSCNSNSLRHPADLNLPSITVTALNVSLLLNRKVTNVAAQTEMYTCSVHPPQGVIVDIQPSWFTIMPNALQNLQIKLATTNGASQEFVFGEIILTGSLDHVVRLPLSVLPVG